MDPKDQKRILMDVSAGTPMHQVFKCYWLPIALVSDVAERDGPPHGVRVMGQDYVLFRDSDGRLGLLDERCTHRSASLCLGRNEDGGLRCLYHGWKFGVDGAIVDAPNVQDDRFKERVRQPAYSVREAGSIVWGYFGPAEKEPPFPHYPFFDLPDDNIVVELVVAGTNYSRVVEGLLDSSHTGVLHQDALKKLAAGEGPAPSFGGQTRKSTGGVISQDLAPDVEVQETDFGLRYAALRGFFNDDGTSGRAARITSFVFPSTVAVPPDFLMQLALPVENDRTHFFMVCWDPTRVINTGEAREEIREYYGMDDIAQIKWGLGREFFDLEDRPHQHNNWLQDREAMKRGETFTGLYRFLPEDFMVSASMGETELYPLEHLVPSDLAIARFRRRMIDNAQRVARGERAYGLDAKEDSRGGFVALAEGEHWQDHYASPQPSTR
jgi:phthalate 4,5-dioxygenase